VNKRSSNSRQAVRAGASVTIPGWLWLLLGILLGLALSAVAIWRDWVPGPKRDAASAESSDQAPDLSRDQPAAPAPAAPAVAKELNPEFDFYTVLPEMQVVLPDSSEPPAAGETPPKLKAEAGFRYVLQMGSFGSASDAEALKVKAALVGVQASVQKVSIDEKTFHRVRVGPFATPELLEGARAELHLAGLTAVALREKL